MSARALRPMAAPNPVIRLGLSSWASVKKKFRLPTHTCSFPMAPGRSETSLRGMCLAMNYRAAVVSSANKSGTEKIRGSFVKRLEISWIPTLEILGDGEKLFILFSVLALDNACVTL